MLSAPSSLFRAVRLAVCLLLLTAGRAAAPVPAFPGAEGAGAYATGGRHGTVYRVTNLNTRGPGSLADAVSQPNRIIVFTVSGIIDLSASGKRKASIEIAQPNITIAGQTAPGDGICIKGGALRISAGNVIVRYLRIRRGFNSIGDTGDALDIKGSFEDVIVDHVSTSWATDENLTLTNANRVTAQYSIAAEGLDYFNPNQSPNRHSEGSLFGSQAPGGTMTIHHSIYAHNRLRNPRTTGGGATPPLLDFRNNVIYDWKELASHTGSQAVSLNLVNNYYLDGPSTGIDGHDAKGVIFTFMSDEPHRLYAAGNVVAGDEARTADNWSAIRYHRPLAPAKNSKIKLARNVVRASAPLQTPPVTTQTAAEAFETVLESAGATLPARDVVDLRIIRDIRARTGAVINFETDIPEPGRWPVYHSLPAPLDTDGDGIPDYWEDQFGLDKHSAADAMRDSGQDGYANIEKFLNNIDPRGGALPIVFVSVPVSRAYRQGGEAGEFQFNRTGSVAEQLEVRFTLGGSPRSVTITAGRTSARVTVLPAEQEMVVATIQPAAGYHVGCPVSALVVVENGSPPAPVDLARVDPRGGVSDNVRKRGEANLEAHKKIKHPF
jgi:hypothetical protein